MGVLEDNKAALEKVADALLEYETIDGKHVHEIIDTGEIQSPVKQQDSTSDPDEEEPSDEEVAEKTSEDEEEGEGLEPGSEPAGVPA